MVPGVPSLPFDCPQGHEALERRSVQVVIGLGIVHRFNDGFAGEDSLNFETLQCLPIIAPAQQRSDLVVVTEERNIKLGASVLQDKPKVAIAAALEELASQLTNAKTTVNMGLTITIDQLAKGKQALDPLVLR